MQQTVEAAASTEEDAAVVHALQQTHAQTQSHVCLARRHVIAIQNEMALLRRAAADERQHHNKTRHQYLGLLQNLTSSVQGLVWRRPSTVSEALKELEILTDETEEEISANAAHIHHLVVDDHVMTKRLQETNSDISERTRSVIDEKDAETIEIINAFDREKARLHEVYKAAVSMNAENAFHMTRGTHAPLPTEGSDKAKKLRQQIQQLTEETKKGMAEFDAARSELHELKRMLELEDGRTVAIKKTFEEKRQSRRSDIKKEKDLAAMLKGQALELKGLRNELEHAMRELLRCA
eukprot:PhM_4_TR13087/c0_g1_i1/m.56738